MSQICYAHNCRAVQKNETHPFPARLPRSLDILHRAPGLDRLKNGCSDVSPGVAVCRYVKLSI